MYEVGLRRWLKPRRRYLWDARAPLADHHLRSMQVLQSRWDRTFSEHSHGFRPGRSAHQAVRKAQQYIAEGYRWVVDLDLERFFDGVNYDKLMGRVAEIMLQEFWKEGPHRNLPDVKVGIGSRSISSAKTLWPYGATL